MTAARYVTPEEFADMFRLSVEEVRRRIRQHAGTDTNPATIKAIDVSKGSRARYRIPVSEVARYESRTAS